MNCNAWPYLEHSVGFAGVFRLHSELYPHTKLHPYFFLTRIRHDLMSQQAHVLNLNGAVEQLVRCRHSRLSKSGREVLSTVGVGDERIEDPEARGFARLGIDFETKPMQRARLSFDQSSPCDQEVASLRHLGRLGYDCPVDGEFDCLTTVLRIAMASTVVWYVRSFEGMFTCVVRM